MPQIVLFTFIILMVIGIIIGSYFYNTAVKRNTKLNKSNAMDFSKKTLSHNNKYFKESKAEHVYIQSGDGLLLHGIMVDNSSDNWVIICHPYRAEAGIMGGFANIFDDFGFSILAVDQRGHGASEGKYIGMGWHDSFDVLAWIDYLNDNKRAGEILLYGVSMGGATVMMASGHDLPDNVKGVIEDCGYSSIKEQFKYVLKTKNKLPSFPILQFASIVSLIRAKYSFLTDGNALAQVRKNTCPILFIHGEDDDTVPIKMMNKLYRASGGEKHKFTVPGAKHIGSIDMDEEKYRDILYSFVFKHFNIAGK